MTRQHLERLEELLSEQAFFRNLSIVLLGASTPLGIDKYLEYTHTGNENAGIITAICVLSFVAGCIFMACAIRIRKVIKNFKRRIYGYGNS